MAKRGRKNQIGFYFGPTEEEAVLKFLASDDQKERSKIYNEFLKEPLDKMIDSIIRRYGLYRKGISFEELHADTLSFLITKSDKFENARGKRAYSYYGTICKHYILGLLIKDTKYEKQITSYDDIYEVTENRDDLTYEIDDSPYDATTLISDSLASIKEALLESQQNPKLKMSENECKVGKGLIDILENWQTIIVAKSGNKYHKNSVLSCLRESTHLTTKEIRGALARYKKMYKLITEQRISDGFS